MKLKVLPPTLRKNNHYLVLDVKAEKEISKDEMFLYLWDVCVKFWGECESSNFNLWVMKHFNMEDTEDYIHYKSVLRCQLGYEEKVRSALATATKFNRFKVTINTIGIAGTIKSAISKFIEE